jgi:RNA polymerase sigma-70 factor (ECF subfamily)
VTAIATQAGKSAEKSGAPSELADVEAVARAREGDHEAFRVLVERYQTRVFRLAMRILRDEEMARDAVQEIFIKVYGALRKFEGRSGFYTWLYRLAFNQCLDMRRRDRFGARVNLSEERALEEAAHEDAAAFASLHSEVAGPGEEYERTELRQLLADAISTLPEDARNTLVLRDVDGLSYAEIAEVLEIPKGTVMSRIYYARRKLQESLREAGISMPGKSSSKPKKGEQEDEA